MKKALKWNFKSREYEPYELPDGATSSEWCQMNEKITCAECGKKILYGNGYTSRKIHTVSGMGIWFVKNALIKNGTKKKDKGKEKLRWCAGQSNRDCERRCGR